LQLVEIPAYGIRSAEVLSVKTVGIFGQPVKEYKLRIIFSDEHDAGEEITYTEPTLSFYVTYYHYPITVNKEDVIKKFEYWIDDYAKALSALSGLRGTEKGKLTRMLKSVKSLLRCIHYNSCDLVELRLKIEKEMRRLFKDCTGKDVREIVKERLREGLESYITVDGIIKQYPFISRKEIIEMIRDLGGKDYGGIYSFADPIPKEVVFRAYDIVRGRRKWIHSYELWLYLEKRYDSGSVDLTLKLMEMEGLIIRKQNDPNMIMVAKPERGKSTKPTVQADLASIIA